MKPKPKVSALDKKIAPNPKYRNVETTIDTGNNLRKKLELLEERSQLYKFRNDEVFRRVNVNNLVRLMVEQTKLEYQLEPPAARQPREGEEDERSEFADSATEELEWDTRVEEVARAVMGGSRLGTARSVVSVAQGVGELDREEQAGPAPATAARPFLLLDVREPEDWERGHMVYSSSYTHTRLNRAFDYETREMLRAKNQPGSIIVMLDWDETLASRVATTLTQRGYENVFLLSGGLRVAELKFPEALLVGAGGGVEEQTRLGEGDVVLLERQLEENIRSGESRLTSRTGPGRASRSSSLGGRGWGRDLPARTSTALGRT